MTDDSGYRVSLLLMILAIAAGAGVRAYGVPSHAGGLPTNTGERWGGEKWTDAGICGHYGAG